MRGRVQAIVVVLTILTLTSLSLLSAALDIPPAYAARETLLYGCAHTGAGSGTPGPSTLYIIDPFTGGATTVGLMGITGCAGLAVGPSGTVFAVGTNPKTKKDSLFTVNLSTGAATLVGRSDQSKCGSPITNISFRRSDGVLFGYSAGCVGTINTSTGVFTDLGACALGGPFPSNCHFPDGNALGFSPSNVLFYAECCQQAGTNTATFYTVNQGTGVATVVATLTGFPVGCPNENDVTGLAFDSLGTLWAALKCDLKPTGTAFYLVKINTSTAAVTEIGPTVSGLHGIAWITTDIPSQVVGGYLQPINTAQVLSTLLVQGVSGYWWLVAVAAILMILGYGLLKRKTGRTKN